MLGEEDDLSDVVTHVRQRPEQRFAYGERTLASTTIPDTTSDSGEGEAPAASPFVDVNGDGDLNRRDAFALIGQLRAEGEQNPTGNPVILRYHLGIFRDLGGGNVVELNTDVDGAGPGGIAVPENSTFLLRVRPA